LLSIMFSVKFTSSGFNYSQNGTNTKQKSQKKYACVGVYIYNIFMHFVFISK
jgi:hypothetical protein